MIDSGQTQARCFDAEEYNESVCKLMQRFPKASRLLAEQEIHEFLNDANGYMARTSSPFYRGPREEDLKPPVGLFDKLLVVAWVAILIPAAAYLVKLSFDAGDKEAAFRDIADVTGAGRY